MKLTRQDLDELLVDYLYDELEPARRAAFEQGLAEHPDLVAEVEAHRRTRAAAARIPVAVLPPGLLDAALAEARRDAAKAAPAPGFFERLFRLVSQPAFATAALAVLVVGVGIVALSNPRLDGDDPDRQRLAPVVAPRAAEPEAAVASSQVATGQRVGLADALVRPARGPESLGGAEGALVDSATLAEGAAQTMGLGAAVGGVAAPASEHVAAAPTRTAATAKAEAPPAPRARAGAGAEALARDGASELGFASDAQRYADERSAGSGDGVPTGAAAAKADDAVARPKAPAVGASTASEARADRTSSERAAKAMPEVPIAVPNEADKQLYGRRGSDGEAADRGGVAEPVPPPAPEREAREEAESERVRTAGGAAERVATTDTKKASTEVYRSAPADDDAADADRALVAELWRRYDKAVAEGRWAEAEGLLAQLERYPAEAARVRQLRPQLAKRKADAASRAGGAATPAVETYK